MTSVARLVVRVPSWGTDRGAGRETTTRLVSRRVHGHGEGRAASGTETGTETRPATARRRLSGASATSAARTGRPVPAGSCPAASAGADSARVDRVLEGSGQVDRVLAGRALAVSAPAGRILAASGRARRARAPARAQTTAARPGVTVTRETAVRLLGGTVTKLAARQHGAHRSEPAGMTATSQPDRRAAPARLGISCTVETPSWRRCGPAGRFAG